MFRTIVVIVTLLAVAPQFARSDEPAETGGIAVSPLPEVDENLFAIRVLNFVYDTFSHKGTDVPPSDQISNVRSNLRQLRREFRARGIDEDIRFSIEDINKTIDMYENTMINIGMIEADDAEAREEMLAEMTVDEHMMNIKMYLQSDFYGSMFVLAEELIEKGIKYAVKTHGLNGAKEKALEDEWRRFTANKEAAHRKIKETCLGLSKIYKWDQSEVGFDASADEQWELDKPVASQEERQARLRMLEGWMKRRPRDPFLILEYVQTKRYIVDLTAHDLSVLSDQAFHGARLVPAGRGYDVYRSLFLYSAAELSYRAAVCLRYGSSRFTADVPAARRSVALWDAALRYTPGDPEGELRARKAWALAMAGEPQRALNLAKTVLPLREEAKDKGFAYNFACLSSSQGQADTAMEWFEKAVRLGFDSKEELEYATKDPDLARMRGEHTARFFEATSQGFAN